MATERRSLPVATHSMEGKMVKTGLPIGASLRIIMLLGVVIAIDGYIVAKGGVALDIIGATLALGSFVSIIGLIFNVHNILSRKN